MEKLYRILSNSAIPKVIIAICMPFSHLQENRRTKIKKDIFHVLSVLYILARFCISGSSGIFAQVAIRSAHFGVTSTHLDRSGLQLVTLVDTWVRVPDRNPSGR